MLVHAVPKPKQLPQGRSESGVVNRSCSCKGHSAGGGCSACKKRHETGAHPLVSDVVQSPGQRLEAGTRSFMESRFGWDFGQVRVHADGRAGASAQAIGARAYTLGESVVFAPGAYRPNSADGRALIAHELTHVVQQAHAPAGVQSAPVVGEADSPAEHEAERVARSIDGPGALGPITASPPGVIRRDRGSDAPPPPAPPPSTVAPGPTCGPNVSTQVTDAVSKTKTTFAGWSRPDKQSACDALDSLTTGAVAWDIVELHNNAWILGYRPACGTAGATPPCGSTVQLGGDCYYAGSPNYVIYGVMCKLCSDFFTSIADAAGAARFTQSKMEYWVNVYKGTGFTGLGTPSANFGPSKDWAIAGYNGWPGTAAPAGDRNTCKPTCPTPYGGAAFTVNWVPRGVF